MRRQRELDRISEEPPKKIQGMTAIANGKMYVHDVYLQPEKPPYERWNWFQKLLWYVFLK